MKNNYNKALADFDEAIRLDADDAWAYAIRAWIWATCPDDRLRDGLRAVESALKACELTAWKEFSPLSSLAAAYAETGDFARAAETQEKANDLAEDDDDRQRGAERLERYRDGKPFREE
jgi:tetratricopeptide (TPR) repeat protein